MSTQSTIDRQSFREAMSRVAASIHLVTTEGAAGSRAVTVSSVCSVSDAPATLLACLNSANVANAVFDANGVFAVNVLGAGSEALARAFAGEGALEPAERFALGRWTTLSTGSPVLEDALASFDCRIVESRVVATHRVLFGEVVAVRTGAAGDSLLYRDRRYRSL